VTADAIAVKSKIDNFHELLMVTRKNLPFKGYLCFPGGFVNYNEDPK